MEQVTIWIDLETTGTDPKKHGVIQIAGIIENKGVEVENFNFKVKPFGEDEIDTEALKVNGITEEQISTFDKAHVIHEKLCAIFSKYVNKFNKQEKMVFAGYNAKFDMDFMHAFFSKCDDPYFFSWFWFPVLDVAPLLMDEIKHIRHQLPNFKLATVAEFLKIKTEDYGNLHDAMTDIRITRAVYEQIKTYKIGKAFDKLEGWEKEVSYLKNRLDELQREIRYILDMNRQ